MNLTELEASKWPNQNFDSHIVAESHRLRFVPLKDFTIEDLRLMIGQEIGLEHLVPLALERLEANPFIEGDYYPGDLLVSVLGTPRTFWFTHVDLRRKMHGIVTKALSLFDSIDLTDDAKQNLRRQIECFQLNEA